MLAGDLFSLEIPNKDKPTVLYGILHRESPEIKYGILLKEKLSLYEGIVVWYALLEGKIEEIYVSSKYFKLV